MEWWIYLIIAILLIISLLVLFFVSYYFNKKTPIPKECQDILLNEENCAACKNFECELRKETKINKNSDSNDTEA